MSISRPDPSSPNEVSAATFSSSRRGFDQAEVRDFLRMVAAELARLQERERHLEREVRIAQRSTITATTLDEELVTKMLGEEAARILQVSREAASQIKIRAEEGAARLLREATEESTRLREDAEIESSRRRTDASADAEAELEMARQQGREMVNEARSYRERVLGDLARRREIAREQIEQMVHGRDRLIQAFERSRLVAVDVINELTPLVEPSEYVNLSPTTGPVPIMVPGSPRPVEPARPVVAEVEAPAEVEVEPEAEIIDTDVEVVEVVETVDSVAIDDEAIDDEATDDDGDAVVIDISAPVSTSSSDDDDHREPAPVVSLFREAEVEVEVEPEAEAEGEVEAAIEAEVDDQPRASVDDLFAKLRAARTQAVAERAIAVDAASPETAAPETAAPEAAVVESAPEVEPVVAAEPVPAPSPTSPVDSVFTPSPAAPVEHEEVADTPIARRDEALTPLIVASARKLKRVLADEQNDVLAVLRGKAPVRSLDPLVSGEAQQAARYTDAINSELVAAAVAGAVSMGADASTAPRSVKKAEATADAASLLASDIVRPLRTRLERCVNDADGDNDELAALVRLVYREWKNQRIDEHLDDIARAAFGAGALAGVTPGTPIRWTVDPNGPACPDAEDNSLEGVIEAGCPFPTEHICAPAHSGCRCMIARADA